ncbi:copia protein [Tanacetum coccineum]
METCDLVGTPMETKDKLDLDQNGTLVDAMKYRSMIGALMYLTSSRPDIIHATCLCARYQAKPTEKHLKEVKRIFCYLWGTVNMGLWYTKDSGFELTGFLDADYTGCRDTFKSTSGGTQFLGEKMVGWSSKKQECTLTDYGFHFNKIPIYCDSKSAIAISCNPVQHSRTKHIAVCYHFIKEHVEKGTIKMYFVKTDYQLADLFTKALPVDRFNYLVRRLGNNVVPLRSNTIRLVQNECSFHGLRSEDPIQHLKDFLRTVDFIDLNDATRNITRLRLFHFSLRDQAINWLDRLPARSISTWEDLTTRFLAQFFPPERTAKSEAFKDLVMNFILDQEKKVKQLEEYIGVIGSDFMQLSLEVIMKLKEEIKMEENRVKKIKKIMRYPNTEDLKPLNGRKFAEVMRLLVQIL